MIAVSLALGLVAGATSFLSASLMVPGPAEELGTDEMRERGAEVYLEFCQGLTFEPRFWPECRGDPDEWRARGASRLVAFCTEQLPSRMFSPPDCEREQRPPVALRMGPRPQDWAVGGIAAGVAVAVLGAFAALARLRRRPG